MLLSFFSTVSLPPGTPDAVLALSLETSAWAKYRMRDTHRPVHLNKTAQKVQQEELQFREVHIWHYMHFLNSNSLYFGCK